MWLWPEKRITTEGQITNTRRKGGETTQRATIQLVEHVTWQKSMKKENDYCENGLDCKKKRNRKSRHEEREWRHDEMRQKKKDGDKRLKMQEGIEVKKKQERQVGRRQERKEARKKQKGKKHRRKKSRKWKVVARKKHNRIKRALLITQHQTLKQATHYWCYWFTYLVLLLVHLYFVK